MAPGPQLVVLIHRIFGAEAVALFDLNLSRQDRMGEWEEGEEDLAKQCYFRDASGSNAPPYLAQRILRAGSDAVGALVVRGSLDPLVVDAVASLAEIAMDRHRWFEKEERAETARKSEEMRATVMDALAHEFKTPLTAVRTASSGLLALGGLTRPQTDLAAVIEGEAVRLNDLCTRLLKTAKLAADRLGLNIDEVRVEELLHEVLTTRELSADQDRVQAVSYTHLPSTCSFPNSQESYGTTPSPSPITWKRPFPGLRANSQSSFMAMICGPSNGRRKSCLLYTSRCV